MTETENPIFIENQARFIDGRGARWYGVRVERESAMTAVSAPERTSRTYRAKVTGRHAVTLPADLCRRLNIAVGDTVEIELIGMQATIRRASDNPIPPARGILRDYFSSREEVQRFIEEERRGWEEDEEVHER
jgi:bifunctional DNA-binding transcriptional regulator/antitoxin component of YhaV-PrlF toxin-antitoxin module